MQLSGDYVPTGSTLVGRTRHRGARSVSSEACDVRYHCPGCGRDDTIAFLWLDVGPVRFHHNCGQALLLYPPGQGPRPVARAVAPPGTRSGSFWEKS